MYHEMSCAVEDESSSRIQGASDQSSSVRFLAIGRIHQLQPSGLKDQSISRNEYDNAL